MSEVHDGVRADVHALVADLLPLVAPEARFDPEIGSIVMPLGRARPRADVAPLVHQCVDAPRHSWPRLVYAWLEQIHDRAVLAVGEHELLGDVRRLLRLRIVPSATARGRDGREGFVVTPFGPYFDAAVVIEHPRYGGPLTRDRRARLGLARPGTHAIRNTRELELARVDVTDWPVTLTESVRVVNRPGNTYVSTALIELTKFLPEPCPYGALVAVPRYSTMLLYPVTSRAVHDILPVFAEIAADMHAANPDACTPEAFWWHDGSLYQLPRSASGDRRRDRLPVPLRAVVRRLPRADRGPTG